MALFIYRMISQRQIIIHFKVCLLKKSYSHQGQRGQRDVTSLLQASPLPYSYTASDLFTGSRPVFLGTRLFSFFRLQNIARSCIIFPFPLPLSHLMYTSRTLFSRSHAPCPPPLSCQVTHDSQIWLEFQKLSCYPNLSLPPLHQPSSSTGTHRIANNKETATTSD